jgi:hypothetical protein
MSLKTPFIMLTCIALASFFASRTSLAEAEQVASDSPAASSAAAKDILTDFKDKIVLFEVNRSNALESKSGSVVLAHVRITKVGNRDFIIGDGYAEDAEDTWYKDMTVGVPCDAILRFHAMTPSQFKKYMKMWKEHSSDSE